MADNAQVEIRLKLEQEVKQRNREQYESIFAGIARIQRDRNLGDFYDEADEIMRDLDVPSSAMDLPPDPKIIARYTSMVRRVQSKMATGAQLPGAPGSQQQSNVSPLSPAQHAALSAQLGQAGINVNPFGNFNAPMRGGAPGPAGRGKGVGQSGLPADIQRFAQQYQAELAQIGDEVFDRLEKQVLSDQMREAAIDRIRRIRDDASRQALRFPLSSPSRSAVRDIERGASEMQRRLSGQSSQLGFAGAEQVRYDQDVRAPLQDLIRQGVSGGTINRDALADAMRDAEMRRGDIRSNPNIDPSLARRRTEAMAQDMRQASQLARLFPETIQRGTPGRDLAAVSPGAVAGFENLQRIRADLQSAREGPMGQLASNRQRELLAELNINQQINRVEQERLRSEGLMTRERQHRFNVLQNEYRLTERDVQGAPVRLTSADISRQAAMVGPQALIGQALQRIAFERGDVGGTGGLAMAGQLIAQRGFGGAAMGGMMGLGSRVATGLTGTSGGLGSLIGGLGALATIPVAGAVAAGAAFTLAQVGPAAQLGMGAANLWRRGGGRDLQGLGNNFRDPTGFMTELLSAGNGLAFDRDEVMAAAQTLAQTGGLRGGGGGLIADRTRSTLRAARFLGVDPNTMAQSMGTMESMNLVGAGPNRMSQERFADLLASSINRGGMRGRENDVLTAVTSLTQALAIRGMTTPEMTQNTIGLITAMNASGSPGLRGAPGMQLLGQMDTSVTGARGLQEALLYQAYNRQAGGNMDYLQFIEEQGRGAGSQFFLGAASDIANLGGQDPRRRALALITQYFGGDRSKFGQAMQMDELIRGGNLTPENFARLTGGTMETEGYQPGAGLQGVEELAEAQNSLIRNFQDLASTMLPVIKGFTWLADHFAGMAATAVGNITNPDTEKPPQVIETPAGPITVPSTIPTPVGPIPVPEIPIPSVEPHPTIIQTPAGPITFPDIQIRPPAGETPALPAPPSPGLPSTPAVPSGPSAPASSGQAALAALRLVGAGGVGFRLSNLTGGMFTAANIQALANQRELMIPQAGEGENDPNADAAELIDSFNATFPNAANEMPPYDELVAFYNRWVEQHQDSLTQARGIAQEHLSGLASRWAGIRYSMAINPGGRNAADLAGVRAGTGMTDCSGFVSQVYRELGVSGLPSGWSPNTEWYRNEGPFARDAVVHAPQVSFADIRPGDAIVSSGAGGDAHMGIYIGGGQVTHMTLGRGRNGVITSSLAEFRGMGTDMQVRRMPGLAALQGGGGVNVEEAMAGMGILGLTRSPIESAVGSTATTGRNANIAAVIRTAREMGVDPITALTAISAEGGFDRRRQQEIGGGGGEGMFQFTGPTRDDYGAWLAAQGMNIDDDASWDPQLQTRFWIEKLMIGYRRGNRNIGVGNTDAEIATNAANVERPAAQYRGRYLRDQQGVNHVQVAREILKQYEQENAAQEPQSYTPMDQYGQAAASQMNVAFQPATVTLVWPNGEEAATFTLNPSVDVPSTIDRDAYRTMGYYGNT